MGVVEACAASACFGRVYGSRFGAPGILAEDWLDLSSLPADALSAIGRSPGSVLGSSRKKIDPECLPAMLSRLKEKGVTAIFLTGGNGSMKTALAMHEAAAAEYPELRVIGIPKTVDNDLAITDHTPGYASAARFYSYAVRDIGEDNRSLPSPVAIVEVIGRNAGWVVGATALARAREDDAPHLIYFPERPPTLDQICGDVERAYSRFGRVVIAVCEGLRDPEGNPFGADLDSPGNKHHELASNLAHSLARAVSASMGLRVRSEKPGILGRSCSLAISPVDAAESRLCGNAAVRAVEAGASGVMVALRRISAHPYASETFLTPLVEVAGVERLVPDGWITAAGNDAGPELLDYARPLVGEIDPLPRLF